MPNFTTNLNLEKPLVNENYNIDVFNANADKLDTAIKEVSSKVDNFEAPVKSVNGKTGAVTLAAADIKTVDGKTLEQFKADASSQLDTKANKSEITAKLVTDLPTTYPDGFSVFRLTTTDSTPWAEAIGEFTGTHYAIVETTKVGGSIVQRITFFYSTVATSRGTWERVAYVSSASTWNTWRKILNSDEDLNQYSSYASVKDAKGIYTVMEYKRADGTLYMKSTLSGGTSPNYTKDTWTFYDKLGTTVRATKTWTIAYDTDGKIISKVVK